ncbi:MAG: hypothetical protein GX879_06410, partial [Bacteroidales bacterium]|nr:hypothetical protein [Bacteroidales bacterium]
MKKIIGLIIVLLILGQVFAQAPQALKYQAVVRNLDGSPIVNKALFVRFNIHEAAPNGNIIYQELHASNTNEFGMLNLDLGTGNTGYNFADINWGNGQSKWVSIDIDTTGGSNFFNLGVTQLLSVPYAFYAENAGNSSSSQSFWQEQGSGIFYNQGNVAIGTNSPDASAALDINSTNAGFLPPRMSTAQRDLISNPAVGLMIFNLSTNCLNIYKSGGWFELCGDCIPPPQPTAQSNSPACQGDTIKLFAVNAGGANCIWTGPNGFSSNQENPIITPVSSQHQGTYTLISSNECGSTNPVSVDVSVLPLPDNANAITGETEFCAGTGTHIFSSSAVDNAETYLWEVPVGFTIVSGQNTTSISVNLENNAVSGNIKITPINSCGSSEISAYLPVNVNPLPTQANAGPNQLNIQGTSTSLQANTPISGNAKWIIVSGNGGNIADITNPNSQFSGNPTTVY